MGKVTNNNWAFQEMDFRGSESFTSLAYFANGLEARWDQDTSHCRTERAIKRARTDIKIVGL
jgi:hypothetical protein